MSSAGKSIQSRETEVMIGLKRLGAGSSLEGYENIKKLVGPMAARFCEHMKLADVYNLMGKLYAL